MRVPGTLLLHNKKTSTDAFKLGYSTRDTPARGVSGYLLGSRLVVFQQKDSVHGLNLTGGFYEPATVIMTEVACLAQLADGQLADFSVLNPKCKFLVPFAVRTRYPGGIDPDENDMKIALAYTEDIIKFMRSKIPDLPEKF